MARMPGAQWNPIGVNHTAGGMGTIRGVVIHIMDGSFEGTDAWFRNKAAQASSHFGTARTGKLRQWVDTGDKAWAEADGNPNWLSIENEGHGGDALTDAQINACASVLAWGAQLYGFPLKVTSDPHGQGLGHHAMGGSAWGGHTLCPGSRIVAQKQEIVTRAKALITGEDIDDVNIDDVWHEARIKLNKGAKDEESISPAAYLQHIESEQDAIKATLAKILDKVNAL